MISETAKQLASLYFEDSTVDIVDELAKIASDNNYNAQTIERIVNRTNRNIIVGLQKEAVQGSADPHFTFPTIKTANVIAVLRSAKPSAVPMAPAVASPSLPSLPVPASRASETNMEDYIGKTPVDKGIAISVLSMLKTRLAEKKSNLARIEIAIDDLMRRFEKCAADQMLKGVPVEVFDRLPVDVSPIRERLEGWGHKLASLNQDFDLDEEHPVVKMANEIQELHYGIEAAKGEIEEVQREIAQARENIRCAR